MPTRRDFVTSTLITGTLGTVGAGALLATGPHKAAAQADRRQIVDAQVHLWKAESADWKWGPRPRTATARAVHHRAARIDDG
jgi:hypothetical protein